ncbi:MAG: hypothetical protein HFH45_03130 [Bacilli bacterium]|nr:hypothetical protein [Bacilli bacterium]
MRKYIIIISILLTIFGIYTLINQKQTNKISLSKEEKQILIKNLELGNENTITVDKNVTIGADIKNNNQKQFKIKKVKVTLNNDRNELIDEFYIKINKNIKPNKTIKFSETIKLSKFEERVFATYEIII